MDLNSLASASLPLLERAEAALRSRCNSSEADVDLMLKLGDILRQLGRVDDALREYKDVLALEPECERAAAAVQVLTGMPMDPNMSSGAPRPVPFRTRTAVLSDGALKSVWSLIEKNSNSFVASLAGDRVIESVRRSRVLYREDLEGLASLIDPLLRATVADFLSGQGPMNSMVDSELQLTWHRAGDFYRVHRDTDIGEAGISRSLTFVIFVFQEPKLFEGGDLILFDWAADGDGYSGKYTRIQPRNNCLVLFPSTAWHLVTPVIAPKTAIEYGRFTINGWIHCRAPWMNDDCSGRRS